MIAKKGIDISKWQGDVDFAKVKSAGVEFIIMRCGYRFTVDQKFVEYVKAASAAAIPIAGVYFFSYATSEKEAADEAKFCIDTMKKNGLGKDIPVFYDFEYDTITKAAGRGVTLGAKECNSFATAFLKKIANYGYKTGIYLNMDYYNNMYDHDLLSKHLVWLADYKGEPDIPCTFHQYSSKGSVSGIKGNVDLDYWYMEEAPVRHSRAAVVNLAKSWIGKNEADGSHKEIIDVYNSYTGKFPRNTKMQYTWAWCAAFWSALAIKLGYTDIMPIEISCYYLISAAKKMGCWVEEDDYVPSPADAILYDWNDNGVGDNTGNPDHVGMVEYVSDGYIVVIEGNYSDSVKRRTIPVNSMHIRGFITPKYDDGIVDGPTQDREEKSLDDIVREVITGVWGNGQARKDALTRAGYDYELIQSMVNDYLNKPTKPEDNVVACSETADLFDSQIAGTYLVTAKSGLHLRDGAGTNKKSLVSLPLNTEVKCYGYYSEFEDRAWPLVRVMYQDVLYTGFMSSAYLSKK